MMEDNSNLNQKQLRGSDDQVITYKITEIGEEEDSQFSQNQEDETEIQDDKKASKFDSNVCKNDHTQQSIQQINQSYNKYVLHQNNQQNDEEDNMNFSKNILSLHNTIKTNQSQLANQSAIQNYRYSQQNNSDYHSGQRRYSPIRYQIDAEEIKSKRKSLERETIRMEEEVKFLKQNLLSELYKQKQYENSRLYNLIYILYVASERNKKVLLKESFSALAKAYYSGEEKAEEFYQQKQFQKLYYMWNNWKNYMLDIKVNTLRQLVKQKMISTEKIYEKQSVHYYNKKLKAKSFAGWFYFFKKNKELLARKRQRVNIHEIFSNYNSRDCSPIRSLSKNKQSEPNIFYDEILQNSSAEKKNSIQSNLNKPRFCKVCKVLDKKTQEKYKCQGDSSCKNNQKSKENILNQSNNNSASKLKQKLLQSLNIQQNPSKIQDNNNVQSQPDVTQKLTVKKEKNPSVSPVNRSGLNSRKPSIKVNIYNEPQFFENQEIQNNKQKMQQENDYQSPQRKLQEVIANAKNKIIQFQNSGNPYQEQKQNGYLLREQNDEINQNPYFYNQQNELFTPQSQTISKLTIEHTITNNQSSDNMFATTLKKRKNIDENEYRSTGKINVGSIISQQNSRNRNLELGENNSSVLKDSSSVFQNQMNVQKNIGQQNIQDYYNQFRTNNIQAYNSNQQYNQSPKFNTFSDNKVNFGQMNKYDYDEQENQGYDISDHKINSKQAKQYHENTTDKKDKKQQQNTSQGFTTFKQRSNSISQYCKNKPSSSNGSLYSQITSRKNSLYQNQKQNNSRKPIQTDGFQFVSPNNQCNEMISNKSFYQETRSSSMKKRNDSLGNGLLNYFSQTKRSNLENNSIVFSIYHPTNSKNIRNLSKSPLQSRLLEDEQLLEEQQNEYNPISFENSLRKDNNLNLSFINGSNNFNKSGFLDSSLHNKILTPKEQDKNLRLIEKRAQERKKRLEELKKKQQEWKKQKENEERQNEEKKLEKERDQYKKEYLEYQAIKKIQKKNKKTPEELKEIEQKNNEKAEKFFEKRIQKISFQILQENQECHGKLDTAIDFYLKSFTKRIFKALVNQTINEKDRQRIKEQQQLEKAITFYNYQQKRKCLGQIKIFTYESLVQKENFEKQREEIIMRTAFQKLFQKLPIKKKTEIDVDKVIKQFRKVVLLERCFRGWKNFCQ
ncbi:hypothetical protein TTHERM_00691510 (macronuclear) [Tetrahymena thermophila SB210]|uniref:Uncharacterized protein n=1 Tax=Tetrahymena thermophila (strain SB210) TaxID=312017 RepID=I7MCN9_TETTS|nr:hypothetical protein TTHERM_00691510 [Tetrahymena thermophila SB210]EAR84453.2 hypothetical protein TTHERM_00691510 [Tetrahymena thermophila SB210]|eukprot:XP_001032116.2 hypothetical protein TTHERM_00691510 [Tetrahymena thermophila SB210]